MIEISELQVQRDDKCICTVDALTVAAGERLAVRGSNGSGKTTLLRVLAGLTSDFTGKCQISGPPEQRTYVHQQPFMFRGTVATNVRYGEREPTGQGGNNNWLDRLGIGHLAERTAADLSGGESRRVALARALAIRPKLLLLDEPLADLDNEASTLVCETLAALTDTTIVIASPTALPDGLAEREYTIA